MSTLESLTEDRRDTPYACPRCGETTHVYPAHGPLLVLGDVMGFERSRCGRCGRAFWHRPAPVTPRDSDWPSPEGPAVTPSDSDWPGPEGPPVTPRDSDWPSPEGPAVTPRDSDSPGPEGPAGPAAPHDLPSLADLDVEPASLPPAPPDLAALDAELVGLRPKRRKR